VDLSESRLSWVPRFASEKPAGGEAGTSWRAADVATLRPEATEVRKEATALRAPGPGASAGFLQCHPIRRRPLDDVGNGDLEAVKERTAAEAKPLEAIEIARAALILDDKADRVRHWR